MLHSKHSKRCSRVPDTRTSAGPGLVQVFAWGTDSPSQRHGARTSSFPESVSSECLFSPPNPLVRGEEEISAAPWSCYIACDLICPVALVRCRRACFCRKQEWRATVHDGNGERHAKERSSSGPALPAFGWVGKAGLDVFKFFLIFPLASPLKSWPPAP